MNVHYAVQVCDIANNQTNKRYCNTDRTTLSIKCLSSFIESIEYIATKEETKFVKHIVRFFDDNSTPRLKSFLQKLKTTFTKDNIEIQIEELQNHGIMNSIGSCYEFLRKEGTDLVYQVQDDYLYEKTAIFEMIDVFLQIKNDTNTDCFIYPYNCATIWLTSYKNRPTPRTIFYGKNRVWIQQYDTSCCFMTSANQLRKHKDITDLFLSLPPKGIDGHLEAISLNYIFTQKGELLISPIQSVALHIQLERDKDPYIDWKSWWNSIKNYE